MNIAAILAQIAGLMPIVEALVDRVFDEKESPVPEVVDLTSAILPDVQKLVTRIEEIKNATEAEYPEVWASVRDDWNAAFAKWNAVQP